MLRTPAWAWTWSFIRVIAAAAGLAAIIAQLIRTSEVALASTTSYGGDIPTVLWNFMSFFTIQSNVGALATSAIGAVLIWRALARRERVADPHWFAMLLACVTTYMVITGIVYNTLLRGIPLPQGATVPWSNEILHVWVPIVMALDLLIAPGRRALPWRSVWIVVIYPIVWVIYTMVRGPLITSPATGQPFWYPYPFLNPNNGALVPPGWAGVITYIVGIAIAIIAVGFLVVWVGRLRAARDVSASAQPSGQPTGPTAAG